MKPIKLFIADEERILVAGLTAFFMQKRKVGSSKIEHTVVGTAGDYESLSKNIKKTNPDILIIDIKLGQQNIIEVIRDIKNEFNKLLIVILTSYSHSKFVKAAFMNGVDAYLLKQNDPASLFDAFDAILKNDTYLGEKVFLTPPKNHQANGTSSWDNDDTFLVKFKLTNRELEVLKGIAHGKSNKKIASDLFISDQTVSVHRKNIMRKLNVSNTASLIKYAYDHNLL